MSLDKANKRILILGSDSNDNSAFRDIFNTIDFDSFQLEFTQSLEETLKKLNELDPLSRDFTLVFIDFSVSLAKKAIQNIWSVDPHSQIVICTAEASLWDKEVRTLEYPQNIALLRKPLCPIEIRQIVLTLDEKQKLQKSLEHHKSNLEEITQKKAIKIQYQIDNLEEIISQKTKEIKKSEERYELAAKSANDGLWDIDYLLDEAYFSHRFADILDLPDTSSLVSIKSLYPYLRPHDQVFLIEVIQKHLDGKTERIDIECHITTARHTDKWVHIKGMASFNDQGRPVRLVGYMSDITDRKAHDQALYQAAFHDELTGLANRALFMNRLEQVIVRGKRLGENLAAIMFLDLDRFKSINDTLGHQIGDEVLKIVSNILKNHTRPTDTISRIGGDEFTVLLDPVESLEEAENIATRILEQLNRAYQIDEKEVYIGSSIGLTLIDDPNIEAQILLRNADLAMYEAKTNQKDGVEIFDKERHQQLLDHMEIESDLRNAVKNDELLVYYQPIIDLKTGHVISFESLMRWRHPQRGFVSPGLFIPLAEEIGLIGMVGRFTVESVCKQLRLWQAETNDCPNISVNISVRQLMDNTMYRELYQILSDLGDLVRFISVEVTETVIMQDPKIIIERLKELRALNMKIYMDDFGTGYSSLSYLANFPLDVIKIDQAFVTNMLVDQKAERLVASIVHLAKDLGLTTVAEGVETEQQMEKLIQLECNYGQGHYFAKAMNAQVAREIVYNHTKFNISVSDKVA